MEFIHLRASPQACCSPVGVWCGFAWIKCAEFLMWVLEKWAIQQLQVAVSPCWNIPVVFKYCTVLSVMEVGQGVCFLAFSHLHLCYFCSQILLKSTCQLKIQGFCSHTTPALGEQGLGVNTWICISVVLPEDELQKAHVFLELECLVLYSSCSVNAEVFSDV